MSDAEFITKLRKLTPENLAKLKALLEEQERIEGKKPAVGCR